MIRHVIVTVLYLYVVTTVIQMVVSLIYVLDTYYMAFFISHVISTRDAHISPKAEVPRANMGRGLIWHVI
jgi:hypothetical protein